MRDPRGPSSLAGDLDDPVLISPGGAAAFTPADLANLVLWLDSEHVTSTGALVDTMTNRSGTLTNVASSGAARATLVAGDAVFGGKPSLSFAGAQYYQQATGATQLPCDEPTTIAVIGSVTTSTGAGPRAFLGWFANQGNAAGSYTAPEFYLRIQATGLARVFTEGTRDTNLTASSNVAHLWLVTHDGGSSMRAYRDGTEMSSSPATLMTALTASAPLIRVGTSDSTVAAPVASFLIGKLGAILIWDRVLGAGEQTNLLTWSRAYYGTP